MEISQDDVIKLEDSSVEMWLEGVPLYGSTLWYGVRFEGTSATGTRTGNIELHKTLPIQSKFKGCTVSPEGTVKYLNPSNWDKYEDGTNVDTDLNIMVEIPQYYIRFEDNAEEDYVDIKISEYPLQGFVLSKKCYVGAYEGYMDMTDGIYKSIAGVNPTVSKSRFTLQSAARANHGGDHWNIYNMQTHKSIVWCYVIEYANRNVQTAFTSQLTDGLHTGGLGDGVTIKQVTMNGVNTYNFVTTGVTKSLGNTTGIVDYTFDCTDADGAVTETLSVNVPSYRGIENPFGHIHKNIIDMFVDSADNVCYYQEDYTKYPVSSDKSTYKIIGYICKQNGYIRHLINYRNGIIVPFTVGDEATSLLGYTDYNYTSFVDNDRTIILGGGVGLGSLAGWFYVGSHYSSSDASSSIGSRLTYMI